MARQSRGIEVFGRGATVVERRAERPRTRLTGALGVLAALVSAVLLVLAILAVADGQATALGLAVAAVTVSVLAVILGLAALVGNRGRVLGLAAILLGLLSNPWVLTRVLEYIDHLVSG